MLSIIILIVMILTSKDISNIVYFIITITSIIQVILILWI